METRPFVFNLHKIIRPPKQVLSGCSSEAQRTRHASRLQEVNIFECGKMSLITIASRKPDSIHVREQEFYHLIPH